MSKTSNLLTLKNPRPKGKKTADECENQRINKNTKAKEARDLKKREELCRGDDYDNIIKKLIQ